MALKKHKPTSPGLRGKVSLVKKYKKSRKVRSLLKPLKGHFARSNGRVSVRHRSRGAKKQYRKIDFKRDKYDIEGNVVSIDYDPNRGSSIALINYVDGERRYILRPRGLEIGDKIVSKKDGFEAKAGFATFLRNMPVGSLVHNVELHPGKGGEVARGAGGFAVITAKEKSYVNISLPSGEVKKFLDTCMATFGVLDNDDLKNVKYGKAGIKIYMGRRPKVRGVAYSNPTDHPHGGSYKTSGVGRKTPVSPWGQPAKGYKTRNRKHTDKYIISRKK